MKVALLSLAVLGAQLTTLASDRMPQVNVDALCKAMSADARLMRMAVSRTVADCVSQENDAKRELDTIWGSTSGSIRNQCESDGTALETRGYLDLLSCIYIAVDTKSAAVALSGAGKKRRTK
jgi:hypothetical protein